MSIHTRTAHTLLDGYGVTESLRWHDHALWFSDLAYGTINRWTHAGGAEEICTLPGRPSGLGFLANGDLLAVSMDEQVVYRLDTAGGLSVHADISSYCGGQANDMLVTPDGWAYVGNFGFDYHAAHREKPNAALFAPPGPPATQVVCINPEGTIVGTGPDMLFPNGMVALPGTNSLVIAETLRLSLTECDIAADGTLENPRPFAHLQDRWMWNLLGSAGLPGKIFRKAAGIVDKEWVASRTNLSLAPDGIALHTDQRSIWVANATKGEAVRVGRGGKILEKVRTSQHTLDCVVGFGGRKLFLATTFSDDPTIGGPARQGKIEVVDLV